MTIQCTVFIQPFLLIFIKGVNLSLYLQCAKSVIDFSWVHEYSYQCLYWHMLSSYFYC
uniref:Uncharacterized protein n=1 Tax=Anguilla anguilla TaxID=7936 RepID=A0A0E9VU15_ANGAN